MCPDISLKTFYFWGRNGTFDNLDNFFAVRNLKMALKKQTFYNILKAFSSDTPQSIKCQNNGPKKHDEKYISSCGSK